MKKLFEDELYILFWIDSLNDITNQRKLTLVFNKLDEDYSYSDNDVQAYLKVIRMINRGE